MDVSRKVLSDVILHMKYARYLPDKKRRETWDEVVERNMKMHLERYPKLENEIRDAYRFVFDRKVLPSMRTMQFAGRPIDLNCSRAYNCSYLPINVVEAFSEAMFLLLGGTGVGYSVQTHHIEQLPPLRGPIRMDEDGGRNRRYLINDSLEGWAETIKVLMEAYFYAKKDIDFDYRDIRPKGAQLLTAGGKAPGPQPLKDCVYNVRKVLDNALEQRGKNCRLTSLEVHDIMCYIADAVLSGGIRRSAMISFFSYGDDDMLNCKNGAYWETAPQRGRANNSIVLLRHKLTFEVFNEIWERIKANNTGEPGIFLTNDKSMLGNPCFRKGTLIHTRQGHYPIESLVGKTVDVWDGKDWVSIDNFRITAYDQDIIEVELHDGSVLATTPYHSYILADGTRKEAKDLVLGDSLALSEAPRSFGNVHVNGAYLKGFLVGDGTSIKGTRPGLWLYEPKFMCQDRLIASAKEVPVGDINTNAKEELAFKEHSSAKPDGSISPRMDMQGLAVRKAELHPYTTEYKKRLPVDIFSWDHASIVEFIAGVLDADGTASDTKNGFMYQITSIHREWCRDFQTLLKVIGVQSKLSLNKNGGAGRGFNDGYGEYPTQDSYRLTISQAASIVLAEQVRFTRLVSFADKRTSYSVKPRRGRVVALRQSAKEGEVYCCTVPTTHSLALSCGIQIGQCLEASLHENTFCNLVTIHVSDIRAQDEFEARCKAAAFISTLQAGYTDFHYLREVWRKNTEKDALLGISMTGIATKEFLESVDMTKGAQVVLRENERVAKSIGINKAARTTLTKPDGTSSLLLGCSSGIHAWYDRFYIRRVRVGKNEAIYTYFKINNPDLLEDDFLDKNTAIISLPIKAPGGCITREESALDTLERVKKVYREWIVPGHRKGSNTHNSSVTISIAPDEWDKVRDWMWENRKDYNGISVLPHDGGVYKQAPFESITEEQYNALIQKVHSIDLAGVFESEDHTNLSGELACAGGACEVK